MPKLKSHSGAKKRVKRTGTGKFARSQAFTSHIKTSKTTKRKRNLRKHALVSEADQKRFERMLPTS